MPDRITIGGKPGESTIMRSIGEIAWIRRGEILANHYSAYRLASTPLAILVHSHEMICLLMDIRLSTGRLTPNFMLMRQDCRSRSAGLRWTRMLEMAVIHFGGVTKRFPVKKRLRIWTGCKGVCWCFINSYILLGLLGWN